MKNVIRQIKVYGIFADTLKIIAMICMVIDHIGFYFYEFIPRELYVVLRKIGMIAMPIFVFLLVQGFFKTSNFKKYVLRIGIFAIITQVLITGCYFLNVRFFPAYSTLVYRYANILFSFCLTLLLLKVVHEPIILKQYTKEQNIIVKVILGICILAVYLFVPFDHGMTVPIFALLLYAVERFRITVLMAKGVNIINIKGFVLNMLDHSTIEMIYKGLIVVVFGMLIIFFNMELWRAIALLPILLYNGERKASRNRTRNFYYVFFPVHHTILYVIAMLLKGGIS